ncbi:hypothetical protein ACFQMA_14030 [Halosimplex aquaticum]|uniref:Small CPxCG-related zinc finger protein n=1 Tax=Halosimplex aquaticum TaxID=3026162 RepID=A0ABD5Y0U0_9EURY|nr:hypothetical protein [Halosimplex aquaticum]
MIRPPGGRFGESDTTITGQMVPCPDCGRATGVPVPNESTIVDAAEEAEGSSTTKCPHCDRRFEVGYRLESDD